MNIFLTGGTGFIGSWVVRELLNSSPDHRLVLLARTPDKIPAYLVNNRISMIQGTLTDFDVISTAMNNCDACIHLALGWGETPLDMLENDTRCTIHILQRAVQLKMKKFIYTSSTAAGGHDRPAISESSASHPADLYGATKLASEAYVRGVSTQFGLPAHIIRPGYTFGNPAIDGATTQVDHRIHTIVQAALKNAPIHLIKEDGTQFISAPILAKLFSGCLLLRESCQTFYGLGTRFISWEKIARMAIEKTGSRSSINIDDRNWKRGAVSFDVGKIKRYFDIASDSMPDLDTHIDWIINNSTTKK